MMKQKHTGFVSDVFTLLECIGAKLNVCKYGSMGVTYLVKYTYHNEIQQVVVKRLDNFC